MRICVTNRKLCCNDFYETVRKACKTADMIILREKDLDEEISDIGWFDFEETYEECLNHNQKFCAPIGGLETVKRYLSE